MDIFTRYQDIKGQNSARDLRHWQVSAARRGDVEFLMPGMFPENFSRQATANVVNIASRDVGEMLGPLPAINCRPRGSSQAALNRASKKNRIAASYVEDSQIASQMASAGDRFASFGHMAFVVEPDFEEDRPNIRANDFPVGAYYTLDLKGRVVEYFKGWTEYASDLAAKFPEFRASIITKDEFGREMSAAHLEVVKAYYWDDVPYGYAKDENDEYILDDDGGVIETDFRRTPVCVLFVPARDNLVLRHSPYYGLTRMPVTIAERPKWDDEVRGQFDEAIWVQTMRARMELFTLQAADESINAPIQLPSDVTKISTGPRAVIHTNSDRPIGRVRLDLPQGIFAENARLAQEERLAARYPEGRSGNIDASVITGQGVQALLGTLDTQLKSYQEVIGRAFKNALSVAFEMDEMYWGGEKKHIEGTLDGELFEEDYDPARDIRGDYRVDISYGFAAGLDPNRALVFLLQLRGDRLVDRDTVMRQLPFDVDVNSMKERIDNEEFDDALKQGVFSLAAQIGAPEFAGLGIDPRQVVRQIATIKKEREKGKPLHEAIEKAFEPTEEELAAQEAASQSPLDQLVAEDQALAEGAEIPSRGLGSPQAGSTGDIQMLLAGLTPGGNANLQANMSRMRPA